VKPTLAQDGGHSYDFLNRPRIEILGRLACVTASDQKIHADIEPAIQEWPVSGTAKFLD
jgi:hypothetical protein